MVRTKYIALVLLLVWILSMIYMTFTMNNSNGGGVINSNSFKNDLLDNAMKELEKVKRENEKLSERVRSLGKQRRYSNTPKSVQSKESEIVTVTALEPSLQHEILRRRVASDVKETWFYVKGKIKKLQLDISSDSGIDIMKVLDETMEDVFEYYSVTSNDLDLLASIDGTDQWRLRESQELSKIVVSTLEKLNNPPNCTEARMILCNLAKGCGFGCQVHHLTYCLITSLATNRTLVIDSAFWRYLNDGWAKFFIPPSRNCLKSDAEGGTPWKGHRDHDRVVILPIIDSISPRPQFLPPAIPKQFADRLMRFHGNPFAWWAGQMVTYLLRPQPILAKVIEENMKKLKFEDLKGAVGVHIRRTDKLAAEAAYHSLDEYMGEVNKYFDRMDLARSEPMSRAIYLATDDPDVFAEVASKYPKYIVYGNKVFSETASLKSRYTEASLKAVILDVYFLSMCDYLVCTFSSQVCRLSYEIMQTSNADASDSFISLDDIYYFGGQLGHRQIARLDHIARNVDYLSLSKGDHINVAGNHWDGYSMGEVHGKSGLYPSFKVLEKVEIVDFPIFNEYFNKPTSNSSKNLKGKDFGIGDDESKRTIQPPEKRG